MSFTYITPTSGKRKINISLMGYNYDWLTNIFLSSANVTFPSLTGIDRFTNLRRVSAICPPFSGYELKSFTVVDKNLLILSADTSFFAGTGLIDAVFMGRAGYSKLSDMNYLINIGTPAPEASNFILLENNFRLLQEDGGRFIIEF